MAKTAWQKIKSKYGDNPYCHYCGDDASTADHIIPKSKGGGNSFRNIVPACKICNLKRGNMNFHVFKAMLKDGII